MAIDWGLGYRAPDDSVAAALQAFGTGRQLALQQQTQQRGENLRTAVRAAYNPATGALDPNAVQGAIANYGDPAELIQYHQQLDAQQQAKHAKTIQEIGQAAQFADTPEKWDKAVDYLATTVDPSLARYKGQFSPENRMAAIAAAGQYEAWRKAQEPVISHPGDIARDPNTGAVVYDNPEKTKYIPTGDGRIAVIAPDGNIGFQGGGAAGGAPAGGGGVPQGTSPKMAAVASTLSGAGLPAPVVAGFMGNFHVEGGYSGAQGDGGSASGIAQLRGERRDNFVKQFGKDPSEASPQEQAQFVAWEMQHPEAAGMTVAQRDRILAAKTAPEAAALIDQFYERSDGTARQGRMAAATAWANGGAPVGGSPTGGSRVSFVGEARPDKAPTGFRYKADGKTLEPIPGGPADAAILAPDVLRGMAEQYLAGDKSVFQNLGRGAQGATNIVRLRGEVSRQMAAQGMNGRDVAAKMAEFNGLVAGERTVGTRAANIEMAADEASRVIPLAREASHAFPRNGFTPLARAMQAVASGTNDPRLRRFVTANTALVNVYARAITPSGQPHESDKQHARAMLDTAYDQPSYDAVLDQMEKEIQAAQRAPGDVRAGLRTAITGDAPTADRSPVRPANAPPIGEARRGYRYKGGDPSSPSSWQKM
jgi:hypothetical protein